MAVGCSIWAEVQNGAWIGQEPAFESPVNMGTHCAKGAATRELAIGHRRLKHPVKLEGGKWRRISWDQAYNEIAEKMQAIRKESGPDALFGFEQCLRLKLADHAAEDVAQQVDGL